MFVDPTERDRAKNDSLSADFYSQALEASKEFRKEYVTRKNIVKSAEMPMERSADGLIKHIIREEMNTKECCLDLYMQFIESGKATGTSRHLSEEVAFVIEGEGYDHHFDVNFHCADEFVWEWETTPKVFEWKAGDFIYIPPYSAHKRFNTSGIEARIVVMNSRMPRLMGFDWFDQLEPAEGFEDCWVPPED
jgi:oxalate decarboxylase/phosphoglucose isomerase-like protein (cupin superfamily)